MMSHLDGRWRRQSLVYFGEPQDLQRRALRDGLANGRATAPGPTRHLCPIADASYYSSRRPGDSQRRAALVPRARVPVDTCT